MTNIERAGRVAFETWHRVMEMPFPPWETLGEQAKRAWEETAKESALVFARARNPNLIISTVAVIDRFDR